jgi:hypothetical protein
LVFWNIVLCGLRPLLKVIDEVETSNRAPWLVLGRSLLRKVVGVGSGLVRDTGCVFNGLLNTKSHLVVLKIFLAQAILNQLLQFSQ